ncbi:MAG: RNA polymerase sigma-54 factor, partial [Parasporobacterium sp.]|nr:RNA polymerase sigma-54 factor [Parasporobacterium sp.]
MDQELELKQKQTITSAIIQSMEILQMGSAELESYIDNLAYENPFVEISDCRSSDEPVNGLVSMRSPDFIASTDFQNREYYKQDRAED